MEDQVERVLTAFGAVSARSAHSGAIHGRAPRSEAAAAENAAAAGRAVAAEKTVAATSCVARRDTCPVVRPNGAEQAELCAVILREKDLTEAEYYQMLCKVKNLCNDTGVLLISHNYVDAALDAGVGAIHLPMPVLRKAPQDKLKQFSVVGASAHSVLEAKEAVELGATYITASHIFPTDCKKGLPPRGLDFLTEVCGAVSIPVYALGGVNFVNAPSCIAAGAAGVCMMSEFMKI